MFSLQWYHQTTADCKSTRCPYISIHLSPSVQWNMPSVFLIIQQAVSVITSLSLSPLLPFIISESMTSPLRPPLPLALRWHHTSPGCCGFSLSLSPFARPPLPLSLWAAHAFSETVTTETAEKWWEKAANRWLWTRPIFQPCASSATASPLESSPHLGFWKKPSLFFWTQTRTKSF